MARRPGRDQTAPMERLVRLIGALTGQRNGTPLAVLLTAVAPAASSEEARRKMLQRDLEHLNELGYDVRNIAEPGTDGVYLMRARDNRLRVSLTPEQRGELLRAAIAAGLDGMATHLGDDPPTGANAPAPASADLDLVQRATTRHCLVRFTYKGGPRLVHPVRVHSGPSGWYLTGREDGGTVVKEFVVSRMSGIALERPGSAEIAGEPVRRSLDPLTWEVDPATEVVLAVPVAHRVLAENLLGTPDEVAQSGADLVLTYRVTHRQVFCYRLYELGTRVRVVSPPDVRAQILAELRSFLEPAS